jgi:hypothetical protein
MNPIYFGTDNTPADSQSQTLDTAAAKNAIMNRCQLKDLDFPANPVNIGHNPLTQGNL